MFDLENAVSDWKARLADAGSMTRENVAELEGHLHELVSKLSSQGLSPQEAFAVATMRLGTPAALGAEFNKVNGNRVWPKRILWMLCGYLGGVAVTQAVAGVEGIALALATMMGIVGAPAGAISALVAAACWAIVLLALYRLANRRHSGAANGPSFRWLAALATAIVFGSVTPLIGGVHSMTQPHLTDWAVWRTFGGLAVNFFVMAGCVAMVVSLQRLEGELAA